MLTVFSSARLRDAASHILLRCRNQSAQFLLRQQRNQSSDNLISHSIDVHVAPFRKQLKEEAKQRRATERSILNDTKKSSDQWIDRWELTVGIEIHAQLNTNCKLFSGALTSVNDEANSHVSAFDLAFPGSQPEFQKGALLPALRAAIAFNCNVKGRSNFDRKHYFYQDQPAGYQITQYYEPFAEHGSITVYDHDGIDPADGESITVGIKQIQLEQDTAKTTQATSHINLLDFNRVSHPLIEIITLPQIHHPLTAAACVKKIQAVLQAVNAVFTGMEMGGLRADVNVSVQPKLGLGIRKKDFAYAGITGLGQPTEIKNLSSFKAVEDAIVAERDRQIGVLESGGIIVGETRGWTLGTTTTRKLRNKEGEVDYRYLPDPDIPSLIIDPDLIHHIENTLPMLPDQTLHELCNVLQLAQRDAKTLIALDDGERLDYYDEILCQLGSTTMDVNEALQTKSKTLITLHRLRAKTLANWVLHELGGLLNASEIPFSENKVSVTQMASIVRTLIENRITGKTAKRLLSMAFDGDARDVEAIIKEENMELQPLSREEYLTMARDLIKENDEIVQRITVRGEHKKVKFLVGQMMRNGGGKVEALKAEATLQEVLGLFVAGP